MKGSNFPGNWERSSPYSFEKVVIAYFKLELIFARVHLSYSLFYITWSYLLDNRLFSPKITRIEENQREINVNWHHVIEMCGHEKGRWFVFER